LKIADIVESIRDWDEHPFVKMNDLYQWFKIVQDDNMKIEIGSEILEEIDQVIEEFKNTRYQKEYLDKIKIEILGYIK
jgi:hypothetical protein